MQPGIGAMIHILSGGSDHDPSEYYGNKIVAARLDKEADPERVEIVFDGGKTIHIWDNGQSCCESRYITCDDDWAVLIGGKLLAIETKPGPGKLKILNLKEDSLILCICLVASPLQTSFLSWRGRVG